MNETTNTRASNGKESRHQFVLIFCHLSFGLVNLSPINQINESICAMIRVWTRLSSMLPSPSCLHPEFSDGITTLTVQLLCSNGHLVRSRWAVCVHTIPCMYPKYHKDIWCYQLQHNMYMDIINLFDILEVLVMEIIVLTAIPSHWSMNTPVPCKHLKYMLLCTHLSCFLYHYSQFYNFISGQKLRTYWKLSNTTVAFVSLMSRLLDGVEDMRERFQKSADWQPTLASGGPSSIRH